MQDRNRRQILKGLAAAGLGLGLGKRILAQSCSLAPSPALTEGPYFVDEILNRSDITVDPSDRHEDDTEKVRDTQPSEGSEPRDSNE